MTSREKTLFYSLWAIILLGIGIWVFRPQNEPAPIPPEIFLSKELKNYFQSASLLSPNGTEWELELSLEPQFLRSLVNPLELSLGVEISSSTGAILSKELLPCPIQPNSLSTKMPLILPKRVQARKIRLFLP